MVVPSRSPVAGFTGIPKSPLNVQKLPLLTLPISVLVVTTWPNWLNKRKPSEKQLDTARESCPPACKTWLLMTRLLAEMEMSPPPVGALMVPWFSSAQPAIKVKLPLSRHWNTPSFSKCLATMKLPWLVTTPWLTKDW